MQDIGKGRKIHRNGRRCSRIRVDLPALRVARLETMPTDSCWFFYECSHCKALLRPKPGDCCVFCSFGSVKCPPMQRQACCDA